MKYLSIALVTAIAILHPSLSEAKGSPTGQLSFTLKKVGAPINVASLPEAGVYAELQKVISAPSLDGAKALDEMRRLEPTLGPIQQAIEAKVMSVIDPDKKCEDVFALMEAKENKWAMPIFQYAYGDESDNEPIYVTVNREMRDGKPDSPQTTVWVTQMRGALWHLPKFEGISFRGTRLLQSRIDKYYAAGKPAVDAAFISTSVNPSTAFTFATPGVMGAGDKEDAKKIAIVSIIMGKTGRPVSAFAWQHSHEQEILFANGTPMKVVKKSPIFQDATLGKTVVVVLAEN